jgi:hypothetical protein
MKNVFRKRDLMNRSGNRPTVKLFQYFTQLPINLNLKDILFAIGIIKK